MNGKIKIKQGSLLIYDENGALILNPNLRDFINTKFKSARLGYDVGVKLRKAVDEAVADLEKQRIALLEDYAVETEYTDAQGKTQKTKRIVEKDAFGKEFPSGVYNVEPVQDEYHRAYKEMMNLEIELNAYPIKMSRLADEDCSGFAFNSLDAYINDDMEKEN